jgi:DNA-binding LacI/PurR family transcriptional regulator
VSQSEGGNEKVTIDDVAKHAGVSKATVSAVIKEKNVVHS